MLVYLICKGNSICKNKQPGGICLKVLKTEIKKAFDTPGFLVAMLIGFGCIFYKNFLLINHDYQIYEMCKKLGAYMNINAASFYDRWIIGYLDSSIMYIFYFLGIIASLPYGISYCRDKKVGIIKNICTRCNRKSYLLSKYVAVFVVGGVASVFPVVLDFMMANLYQPYNTMRIEGSILCGASEWLVMVIEHPYICAIIIMCLWFVFGGALATISLMVSVIADNIFTIQLTPFFVMLAMFYLPSILPVRFMKYFPFYFLTVFSNGNPVIGILVSFTIIILSFSVFMICERRRDIL